MDSRQITYGVIGLLVLGLFALDFRQESKRSRVIHMSYTNTHLPYIKTTFGKSSGSFILDTGGSYCLEIDSTLLDSLSTKKHLGDKHLVNYSQKKTSQESYLIKNIKFLDLDVEDMVVYTVCDNQEQLTRLPYELDPLPWDKSQGDYAFEKHNYIGHEFLKATNCLFDFKNSALSVYPKDKTPRYKFPYSMACCFNTIRFDYEPGLGYVCEVFTDYGMKRCLLDTGSSISFLKIDHDILKNSTQTTLNHLPKVQLKLFKLGSKCYQGTSMYILEDFKIEGIDGVIGMDFFHDKKLFINHKNETVTIF